jgi:selenocysteine-specific elongation factor
VGLVDGERQHRARAEIAEQVAGSFLEATPVVAVDAPSAMGLAELIRVLDDVVAGTPVRIDHGRPRLWIDRSFTVRGAGTVVTGTLTGGSLAVHDGLEAVPGPPPRHEPLEVRVRGLQTHKRSLPTVPPGQRVAVNLIGVPHTAFDRGQALVRPGQWTRTRTVDASLHVLASLDHDVGRRGAYQAFVGSSQHAVALRILGSTALAPGERGLVRIHLPVPLTLLPGDRYVLRESGRSETVGGGEVLDVDPVLPAGQARPDRSVDRVVAERAWTTAEQLEQLTGERREPNVAGRWIVDGRVLRADQERLRRVVDGAGPLGLDMTRLSERDRAVLSTLDDVAADGLHVRPARFRDGDVLADHPFVAMLESSLFAPPDPREAGVAREELRELVRSGRVVERDGYYFSDRAMSEAALTVAGLLTRYPEGITASTVRAELCTTRKYVLPILGYLDATGVTRRRGDLRIAGPRLPVAPE